jgi:hypothetical protein
MVVSVQLHATTLLPPVPIKFGVSGPHSQSGNFGVEFFFNNTGNLLAFTPFTMATELSRIRAALILPLLHSKIFSVAPTAFVRQDRKPPSQDGVSVLHLARRKYCQQLVIVGHWFINWCAHTLRGGQVNFLDVLNVPQR